METADVEDGGELQFTKSDFVESPPIGTQVSTQYSSKLDDSKTKVDFYSFLQEISYANLRSLFRTDHLLSLGILIHVKL